MRIHVCMYMCVHVCTACVWTCWCKCGLLHSVFWASKPAVAMALPCRLSCPQNPDVTAGPLSRQSSGGHPRPLPQTSTADDRSLPPSVVQVLAGAPRVGAGRRWARSVGESIEGGKRNKRVGRVRCGVEWREDGGCESALHTGLPRLAWCPTHSRPSVDCEGMNE